MAKVKASYRCRDCGQHAAQWVGRCAGCGAWGTLEQARVAVPGGSAPPPAAPMRLDSGDGAASGAARRVATGLAGVDRVLGGGLVPGSVVLLAGEPGIGKSTLLLHLLANLAGAGRSCLLVSGEESHAQVAERARRLGIDAGSVSFASGRDLGAVLEVALSTRPHVLAVDSIQTIRDVTAAQMPGGVSQVRICTDALVGLAKAEDIAVVATGHVTKDGDLAGPRALEHAVDVVLTFDGDPRSGLRVLGGGKNRFGAEGETAWFEMGSAGLSEIDPSDLLVPGDRVPGAAVALPQAGRRALAIEVQALVGASEGPARRQATGLDPRRFSLVAAVLDRAAGLRVGRAELFGATSGGVKVNDPACDLAIAVALASAATGSLPPAGSAFVGEVALTGLVRPAPAMAQRVAAARAAGCTTVYAAPGSAGSHDGVQLVPVRHIADALRWALRPVETSAQSRTA